ncbi:hypothetical protein RMATCC62417_14361 [Rhizopus microsporus]|nr:hypothetical protein RMATCC62417_14361 [Rhizopus microsporus]
MGTGLRLKWSDIILTMKDVGNDSGFKVDLRFLNDKVVQRHNKEVDVTVTEAAKNDPGTSKYQFHTSCFRKIKSSLTTSFMIHQSLILSILFNSVDLK